MSVTNGKPANRNGLIPGTAPDPTEGGRATSMALRSENAALEQLILMLRRRWQLILVCAVMVTGAAIVFSLLPAEPFTRLPRRCFSRTRSLTRSCLVPTSLRTLSIPRVRPPRTWISSPCRLSHLGQLPPCICTPGWFVLRSAFPVTARPTSPKSALPIQFRSAPLRSLTPTFSSTSCSGSKPIDRRSPGRRLWSSRKSLRCRRLSATGRSGRPSETARINSGC